MSSFAETLDFYGMFELGSIEGTDKTRVREVRVFAPNWDAVKTALFGPILEAVSKAVMAASAYGYQDDEISAQIAASWPELTLASVSTIANGTRVLIEPV
jgi:hypothetical protein